MFRVIADKQTYRNLLYLLLAFPLGMFYFIFLTTALSLSLGLLVVGVGVPLFLLTMAFWWGFATFERVLAQACLGLTLPADSRPVAAGSTGANLKTFITNPVLWKSLVYLLLKFPFGVFSFVWLTAAGSFAIGLTFAPLIYLANMFQPGGWEHSWLLWVRLDGHFNPFALLSLIVAAPLGLVAGIFALHLSNGMASVWGRFTQMMLSAPTFGTLPPSYGTPLPHYTSGARMAESSPTAWIWQ